MNPRPQALPGTVPLVAPPTGLCSLLKALAFHCFSRLADDVNLSHPCTKAQHCIPCLRIQERRKSSPRALRVRHSYHMRTEQRRQQQPNPVPASQSACSVARPPDSPAGPAGDGHPTLQRKPQGHRREQSRRGPHHGSSQRALTAPRGWTGSGRHSRGRGRCGSGPGSRPAGRAGG